MDIKYTRVKNIKQQRRVRNMKEKKAILCSMLAIVGLYCVFSLGYLLGLNQNSAPYFVAVKPQQEDIVPISPPAVSDGDVPSLLPSEKININTADMNTLDRLPEIGPSRAKSIIEWRETNGPFEKIEDIMLVGGIGIVIFETIENHIKVGEESNDG